MVKWIVDKTVDNVDDLILNLKTRNHDVWEVDLSIYYNDIYSGKKEASPFSDDDCVFYYGSLKVAKTLNRYYPYLPGVLGDFDKIKCSYYYPLVTEYLLNSDYFFVPFGSLRHNFDTYKKWLGEFIFIRPDDGDKLFEGQVIENYYDFQDKNYGFLNNVKPQDLVLLSPAYDIKLEIRFFIIDGEIVDCSTYKINKKMLWQKHDLSGPAFELAKEISVKLKDEFPNVVMDICQTGDKWYLLELNILSCAGFYEIDTNVFIDKINKVSEKIYNETR